jgi:hypothetical protein
MPVGGEHDPAPEGAAPDVRFDRAKQPAAVAQVFARMRAIAAPMGWTSPPAREMRALSV